MSLGSGRIMAGERIPQGEAVFIGRDGRAYRATHSVVAAEDLCAGDFLALTRDEEGFVRASSFEETVGQALRDFTKGDVLSFCRITDTKDVRVGPVSIAF
jgi:predicted transcriptional regulator